MIGVDKKKLFLAVGVVFIAFNLRAPILAIGSLVEYICDDLQISHGAAGMITTIPLVAFALVSSFVGQISGRVGVGITMFGGLLLILVGELIRSYVGVMGIFAGTIIMGIGIAFGNVLIPTIIKLHFPTKIGLMTSIYTSAMALLAGISAGISIPLAQRMGLGWKNALAVWAVLTLVTMIIWVPQTYKRKVGGGKPVKSRVRVMDKPEQQKIYRSTLAWNVTLFMGTQSLLFYCCVAWLPTILQSLGISELRSGYLAFFVQMVSLPASFFIPILADHLKNQRGLVLTFCSIYLVGVLGLLAQGRWDLGSSVIYISIAMIGLGMGATFSLSMSFIGLRSANAKQAASLSGMAQSAGYFLAAVGPILAGMLFDLAGTWEIPLSLFIICTILMMRFGYCAGSDQHVFDQTQKEKVAPI